MPIKRKSILFVISSLGMGGAERLLIDIVNHLNRDRFLIRIVTLEKNNPLVKRIITPNVEFFPIHRRWRYDMRPARQIRKLIIENRIETIIAFNFLNFFYIWNALLGISQKPDIFVSIHSTKAKNFKNFLQVWVYVRLLTGKERLLSVCNTQADYWSKMYWIPRRSFSTIYNGVDCDYFHSSNDNLLRNSIRFSLSIPEDAFIILQVASLSPHKRQNDSLKALRLLLDQNPNFPCYLCFVGTGSQAYEDNLRALTENLMINDHVRFCGSQNDVRPFYEAADVFTLSSHRVETFSIAALEAMSMGLPCVLTDIGGAREMIVEGKNGYLVPANHPASLANAWLKALGNKEFSNHEMIRNWVIEHFSLADCIRKYEKILS